MRSVIALSGAIGCAGFVLALPAAGITELLQGPDRDLVAKVASQVMICKWSSTRWYQPRRVDMSLDEMTANSMNISADERAKILAYLSTYGSRATQSGNRPCRFRRCAAKPLRSFGSDRAHNRAVVGGRIVKTLIRGSDSRKLKRVAWCSALRGFAGRPRQQCSVALAVTTSISLRNSASAVTHDPRGQQAVRIKRRARLFEV
jgi:hypothetical protein